MVGRFISDRMSYRNHYMCSGEATSMIINQVQRIELQRCTIHNVSFSFIPTYHIIQEYCTNTRLYYNSNNEVEISALCLQEIIRFM